MKRSEKGQVLVLVALAIFVLLGLAALGIDVGYIYSVRHELQRSADAGALGGASKFVEPGGGWSSNPLDPVMVEAEARARDYASRDAVNTSPLSPSPTVSDITVSFPSLDRIRVTTQRAVPLFFARIFGRDNQVISATAVAEAAVADTGLTCLKPWGIPLPWNDIDNNFKYDSTDGDPIPLSSLQDGYPMILKVGEPFNNPNNINNVSSLQQEAGHFFALSVCGDTGGNDYRDRIANQCLDNCAVDNGAALDLKTGNMVGPTKQGVNDLMALDPNAVYTPINDGTLYGKPDVIGSIYTDWMESPRLVKIPLYDPSEMLRQGNTQMHVIGFAGFWLQGYDTKQGTVIGYYVKDAVTGASTTGPAEGPALKTLRLVE